MIASGNHLLTQVKDNQPSLRRKLELGTAGRKPTGSDKSRDRGPQPLGNPRIDGVSGQGVVSPYAMGKPDQDRAPLGAHGLQRNPATGLCTQTNEVAFWVSSASSQTPERWNKSIRAHWRIENGSHYVRDTAFAEDACRIRKNPDIVARLRSFAYNLTRASGCDNIRNARWRAALDINLVLEMPSLA